MTSTTLDVALCVLLISAAAGTLVTGSPASLAPDRADAVAETLATSTAEVEYTLAPGARHVSRETFPTTDGPEFRRIGHGTLAELAAEATLGNLSLRTTELTQTSDDFERRVSRAILTAFPSYNVQVVAAWQPYPGAHVGGRFVAGPSPPPNRDVHAATLSAPSGFSSTRERAVMAAETDGFEGVAHVVATDLVSGLFPPTQTHLALNGDYPVAQLVAARYRRLARFYGVDVTAELDERDVEAANERLTAAMAIAIERDLRREFEMPTAAAHAVRLTTVRLVVRTWE